MPERFITSSLPEFFQEQVIAAVDHQHIKLSEEVEFYLVNLLTSFTDTEKLFCQSEMGEREDKALAIQFLEAAASKPSQKFSMLKNLGDLSLYMSGFFSENLIKKLTGRDYYKNMGSMAYSTLSNMVFIDRQTNLKSLFDEMACKFSSLIDVVSEVADATALNNDQNILKLYEKWQTTGSDTVLRLLNQKGIQPLSNKMDSKH
ncbi:MAG: hypothetical protein ACD_73C00473G0002 [uncultured bacterium]|nr:MAG: hypothetical protein ACD_73C00473G0002 [uncultured bacterium]